LNAGSAYPKIVVAAVAMILKHTGNVNGENDDGRWSASSYVDNQGTASVIGIINQWSIVGRRRRRVQNLDFSRYSVNLKAKRSPNNRDIARSAEHVTVVQQVLARLIYAVV
jgi:hypothetical protein